MNSENSVLMMADDDADDREFVEDAFGEAGFRGDFRVVEDGAELMDYLNNRGGFAETEKYPSPNLILLDLNMPKLDGYEALEAIKSDSKLKHIPIIVLSTSERQEDVSRTYDLGVNSFITKPSSFEGLVNMAGRISAYWLNLVKLPDTA